MEVAPGRITMGDLVNALKTATVTNRDPKDCAKSGHQWKMAVHQEQYHCVQCGTPGFYNFETYLVTADEKEAKATYHLKNQPMPRAQGKRTTA